MALVPRSPYREVVTTVKADPLYTEVYATIARRIATGELRKGSQVPPEREFCRELGVSRATIRKAIGKLIEEGLLHAVQGRGTFVTSPGLVEPANELLSFSQLATERGLTPRAVVLAEQIRPSTFAEATRLRVAPGAQVLDLRRLRTLDHIPVAVDDAIVPTSLVPQVRATDWRTASLYSVLSEAGSTPVRSDLTIEARAADAMCAAHLDVAVGSPILRAESTSYTLDERVVEIGDIRYRGDRYQLRTTVVASPRLDRSLSRDLR